MVGFLVGMKDVEPNDGGADYPNMLGEWAKQPPGDMSGQIPWLGFESTNQQGIRVFCTLSVTPTFGGLKLMP